MSVLPLLLLLAGVLVSVNEASSIGSRIIGGESASIEDFPYQVSLRKFIGRHACGGSLITTYKVLTAAHCVDSSTPADVHVVTGSTSLVNGGEYHSLSHIVIHDEYEGTSNTSWVNDIAILTLATPALASETQAPIQYATAFTPGGVSGIASGWGRAVHPGVAVPTELQKLNVPIVTNDECQSLHSLKIYDEHICTLATVGEGICSGDSGGPLVVDGVLVGIASWANLCANGIPDVWVRVSIFSSWIAEHLLDA